MAGSAGNLVQAVDYYPFGQERLCGGLGGASCDAEKKYIGEYYDVDTALNYLNARYYDSSIGRFISQDPMFWSPEKFLTDPQSLNSYSYARNNPISLSDPSGMTWGLSEWGQFIGGAAISVGVGILIGVALVGASPAVLTAAAIVGAAALLYTGYQAASFAYNSYTEGGLNGLYNDTANYIDENPLMTGLIAGGILCMGVCGAAGKAIGAGSAGETATVSASRPNVVIKSFGRTLYQGSRDLNPSLEALDNGQLSPKFNRQGVPTTFKNTEKFKLNNFKPEYYTEYELVDGKSLPGKTSPERLLVGDGGEVYYSPDHYNSQPYRVR